MKQCEPLKEPLHVSEGCAPCPPGLPAWHRTESKKSKESQAPPAEAGKAQK